MRAGTKEQRSNGMFVAIAGGHQTCTKRTRTHTQPTKNKMGKNENSGKWHCGRYNCVFIAEQHAHNNTAKKKGCQM